MTARPKCARCGHAEHTAACTGKGPSGCVPVFGDTVTGIICGDKPPCPCAWRTCACKKPVALAVELPPRARALPLEGGEVMFVSVERGSAGAPDGLLAVRVLLDGFLACRNLAPGEEPAPGEWRGREHANDDCRVLAKSEADPRWLTLSYQGRPRTHSR
jgi:hypothetical protein